MIVIDGSLGPIDISEEAIQIYERSSIYGGDWSTFLARESSTHLSPRAKFIARDVMDGVLKKGESEIVHQLAQDMEVPVSRTVMARSEHSGDDLCFTDKNGFHFVEKWIERHDGEYGVLILLLRGSRSTEFTSKKSALLLSVGEADDMLFKVPA